MTAPLDLPGLAAGPQTLSRSRAAVANRFCCRTAIPFFFAVAAVAISGCQEEKPIQQYTVAKEPVPDLAPAAPPIATEKSRTIGAIVPRGMKAWFFKLTGPDKPVEGQMESFLAFVRSVTFDGDDPKWTLPEGWTEERGSGMRFATVRVSGEPPLELSVIPLDGDATDETYVLDNVNRWRNQLGLAPTTADALFRSESRSEETLKLDVAGTPVVLVNLVGFAKSDGMGGGPFAGGAPPFATRPGSGRDAENGSGASPKVKYTAPKEWTVGKSGGMRKAAFSIAADNQKAEVTVIDLPAGGQGGDWLGNVNRWRGQVGLEATTKSELDEATKTLMVDGQEGQYVELTGVAAGGKSGPQTILAVMVVREDQAWFIKLQGDAALAAREKANFEAFARSLSFAE